MANLVAVLAWGGGAVGGALAFVAVRQAPRKPVAWWFVAGMLGLALTSVCLGLTVDANSREGVAFWQSWRQLGCALLPGFWLLFCLSYGRANGREYLHAWRYGLAAAFAVPVGIAAAFWGQLVVAGNQDVANGFWLFHLGTAGTILNLVSLVGAVLVLMNLECTYRAAVGTMRWRIKYMVLGVGVIFAARIYVCSEMLLFRHRLNLSLQAVETMALILGGLLILRTLARRGHFDADICVPRSSTFPSLTVLMSGAYLILVGVFASLVKFLGGDTAFMLKAFVLLLVLVGVTVVLVSDQVRLAVRRFASRHFQRPLHDYGSLWRKFTRETAACVRQPQLCEAAVKLTADVFQVLSASIWLVDEKKERLNCVASTFLSEAGAADLAASNGEAMEAIQFLERHPDPVDLDVCKQSWAEPLRRCHPAVFPNGGHRVCVSLINGGEMLGVFILGDRVAGLSFTGQDFDLLKCVADSVAAGLRNIQLSEKLLQSGQLQAFQTMSAFFVHDLKNTASTLSLMLRNLPNHYDDPAFREDALRAITKTVSHINGLIERLGQLRTGMRITPASADLNALVQEAIQGMNGSSGPNLVKRLNPLPKIPLDSEQMHKVVANLLFNAREAVSAGGEIRIETVQQNGCVMLTVSDNGCGMPPEFVRGKLFQPFQTTKKSGLGIGLFQSRMIVEAHRGKIQVESQPGKGSTFRITLPVREPVS